ncbi:hypothetical protein OAS06_03165 [Gammaproteobacteria bacterium]|nr:hypothetical protein [Gammaproteobacteria bacterium]
MTEWLLFVEDPGAVNYFVPLVKDLQSCKIPFQIYAEGHAIDLLKQSEIIPSKISLKTINNSEGGPSLVIVGTSENPDSIAFELVVWANRHGIPSAAIVDSGVNAAHRFRGRSSLSLAYAPDYLLVPDNWTADKYKKLGFKPQQLYVVGHPMQNRERIKESREVIRARVFPPQALGRFVLVFVSEVSTGLNPDQYLKSSEYTLHGRGRSQKRTDIVVEEILDAVSDLVSTGALRPYMILRRHPKECDQDLDTAAQEFDYISTKEDPIELAYAADMVVGMSSILLNEAHLLGTPTLAVVPREEESTWLPSVRTGEIPWVGTSFELKDVLERILNLKNKNLPSRNKNQVIKDSFTFDLIKTLAPLAHK